MSTAHDAGQGVTLPCTDLFIGGRWRPARDAQRRDVVAPARGEVLTTIACACAADVDDAVQAARTALTSDPWRSTSGAARARLLWRLADLVERNLDDLARLESADVGRPVAEPRDAELPLVVETLRHFAGWADKLTGHTFTLPDLDGATRQSSTLREPIGVVAAITPWNAPTMIASWKIAPALAAGNVVVLKPAEEAPLTALRLAELAVEAGFPPGVLNVVPGLGSVAGAALAAHPGIDKISFTGSTTVGRMVAAAAAPQLTKLTLELGGKSPQIVWPDADLDKVVPTAALSVFANQGQTCASAARIYVHRAVHDEFVARLDAHARAVRVGDPAEPGTQMGSLINERQLDRVLGYIESAQAEGARLVTGGRRLGERGYFVAPTVLVGDDNLTIAREEVFGPVATVICFDDDDEVLRYANGTQYGLTAVLWTDSASRIARFTRELDVGVVWVNAWGPPHPALPWLGTKGSGVGEELGRAGLEAVTRLKTVNVLTRR